MFHQQIMLYKCNVTDCNFLLQHTVSLKKYHNHIIFAFCVCDSNYIEKYLVSTITKVGTTCYMFQYNSAKHLVTEAVPERWC